jgi:hypothetical protein
MLRHNDATDGIVLNTIKQSDVENGRDKSDKSGNTLQSLPIMSGEYDTSTTLLEALAKNMKFVSFIRWTAGYYPDKFESAKDWWYGFAFGGTRLSMVLMTVVSMYMAINSGIHGQTTGTFFWVATAFDYGSVAPGQYLNQLRLRRPAKLLDSAVMDPSIRIVFLFSVVSCCTVAFGLITCGLALSAPGWTAFNVLATFTQGQLVMYLAFNLLFLVMDLQVSLLLLDQLDLLADAKALNVDKFNLVRDDIHRRCSDSKWATDAVTAPCGASVIAILVILYNLERGTGPYDVQTSIFFILLLLKELLFLAIAFWYVAKVNERADALTKKLSRTVWYPVDGYLSDIERLTICASSQAEPITFSLLFKRLNWNNVVVSGAGFALTVLVGVVKICLGINGR